MRKLYIFYLLFFINALYSTVSAQKPNLQFEQISDKSGRPLGAITGIVQDKHGFLWFSSRNGLYRYDGYSYKVFKNVPNDSNSIPFNAISLLYYDKTGSFWLQHFDVFAAFTNEELDTNYQKITKLHFASDAKIVEDGFGNLWIGPNEKGLLRYNRQSKDIQYFGASVPKFGSPYKTVHI